MNQDLTEEEMRWTLFGNGERATQDGPPPGAKVSLEYHGRAARECDGKMKVAKSFTPRLRVTLRVENEFEGKTQDWSM